MRELAALLGGGLGVWFICVGAVNPVGTGICFIALALVIADSLAENQKLRNLRS